MKKKILLIAVYLGKQPRWMDAYLRSCEKNPDVNWLLMVDWKELPKAPKNVEIRSVTKESLEEMLKKKMGMNLSIPHAHKICDYKVLYGKLFSDDVKNYDFWGFTDIDVIYGNIRKFITDEILQNHDVITASKYFCLGHFTLIRNKKIFNELYKNNRYHRDIFMDKDHIAFDEFGLTEIVMRMDLNGGVRWYHENIHAGAYDERWFSHKVIELSDRQRRRYDFKNSQNWDRAKGRNLESRPCGSCIWNDGKLTNTYTGREVMYIHFNAWSSSMSAPKPNTKIWIIRKEGIIGLTDNKKIDDKRIIRRMVKYYLKYATANPSNALASLRMILNRVGISMRGFLCAPKTSRMFDLVEFEINSMCNRKCNYCPNSMHERKQKGFMKKEIFMKCIDELSRAKYKGFIHYHFYGEPLLDSRLEEFVEYTSRKCPGAESIIFTNGDFLDTDRFRRLSKLGVTKFMVTRHDGRRPTGKFEKSMSMLSYTERRKITLRFPDSMYLSNRAGAVTIEDKQKLSNVPCPFTSHTMVVTLNGNVLPCCNDYFEEEIMGNVQKTGLAEIWNSARFKKFRSDLMKGKRQKYPLCSLCDWA